jgi:hypothetical protein
VIVSIDKEFLFEFTVGSLVGRSIELILNSKLGVVALYQQKLCRLWMTRQKGEKESW